MLNGINQNAIACLMVCLLALSGVGLAQAEPERSEHQYGGIIDNIATRVAQLNALTWNQYQWKWKFRRDGRFADLTRASESHYDCYL